MLTVRKIVLSKLSMFFALTACTQKIVFYKINFSWQKSNSLLNDMVLNDAVFSSSFVEVQSIIINPKNEKKSKKKLSMSLCWDLTYDYLNIYLAWCLKRNVAFEFWAWFWFNLSKKLSGIRAMLFAVVIFKTKANFAAFTTYLAKICILMRTRPR